jgi:hypothetical protein
LIHALISRGILEIDVNFSYSDQGISLTYDNAGGYQTWWGNLVAHYVAMKKQMKDNYRPKGRGIGSVPDFGIGWFGLINSAMDNRYNQQFYPWWSSWAGGRAQI